MPDRDTDTPESKGDEAFLQLERTLEASIWLMKRNRRELVRSRRRAERHGRGRAEHR
jgi:hypothetical protein